MEPPPANTGLILEQVKPLSESTHSVNTYTHTQVPVLYDEIMKEGEGKWNEFARKQSKILLEPDPEILKTQATR